MTFTNQAELQFQNTRTLSNTVTGTVTAALALSKSASASIYSPDCTIEFRLTVSNTTATQYNALTLTDNLGRYLFEGQPRFPLSYTDASAELVYYRNGTASVGTLTAIDTADGVEFTFSLPPQTVAVISFEATPTVFASFSTGATITNLATLTGAGTPLTATLTLPVKAEIRLFVTKTADDTATVGSELTYEFILTNYGNLPVLSTDFVTLSDSFDPILTNLTVTSQGNVWTEGNEYEYNESIGLFRVQPGVIQIPAATETIDDFGIYRITPAAVHITVTGTVAGNP